MKSFTVSDPTALEELDRLLNQARAAVLRPPPRMNLPDWADKYRHLSTSSGAVGGPWQTSRVEVARGPMMSVTEPGVRRITAMTSTQTLKTSFLENVIGYFAHLDPAPMLLLQPKDESIDAFSKERLTPMIKSSPALNAIMGDSRERDNDDTMKFKRFPGGFLALASAGSPTNLAMRAIRFVLMDEIDKYESTKEGDPILLAEERMATFSTSSLSIRVCSPTWEETSRVYRSYLEGDQRRPFVACPHCGYEQTLDFFQHVHWQKDSEGNHYPDTAHIHCIKCGAEWSEPERMRLCTTKYAIKHYQTKPFMCCGVKQDPQVTRNWLWDEEHQVGYACCEKCGQRAVSNRHASFTASKLLSPFTTIIELVEKWLVSKDDPESKQVFINTQLGSPYRAQVSREIHGHWLAERREQYNGEVPEGVLVLTAGIDVQTGSADGGGRLEIEVVGWGLGEESWSISHHVIHGDPALPSTWKALDDYLLQPWKHERGFDMAIMAACIDSGGGYTQDVYGFARRRTGRNIWAIKGASDRTSQWTPLWPPQGAEAKRKRFRTGFKPIMLGVNSGKESIRQRLLIDEPGPGYCHFPVGRPEGWFEQLTSENLLLIRHAGVNTRKWVLQKGRANEALDCRVYAYAALHGLYHTRRLKLERQAGVVQDIIDTIREARDKHNEPVLPHHRPKGRRMRGRML
jgi:phage terminase large subunit GpA-like protein